MKLIEIFEKRTQYFKKFGEILNFSFLRTLLFTFQPLFATLPYFNPLVRNLSKTPSFFMPLCRMTYIIFLMPDLKFLNFLQVGKKSIRRAGSNFRVEKSEGVKMALEVSVVKNAHKRCATYGLSLKIYELQFSVHIQGTKN